LFDRNFRHYNLLQTIALPFGGERPKLVGRSRTQTGEYAMSAEIVDLFRRPGTTERLKAANREIAFKVVEIASGVINATYRNAKTIPCADYNRLVMGLTAFLLEGGAQLAYRELDGQAPPPMVRHRKPRR
jgi:hypothetical protein